jgi:hypothetical protein
MAVIYEPVPNAMFRASGFSKPAPTGSPAKAMLSPHPNHAVVNKRFQPFPRLC